MTVLLELSDPNLMLVRRAISSNARNEGNRLTIATSSGEAMSSHDDCVNMTGTDYIPFEDDGCSETDLGNDTNQVLPRSNARVG